MANYTQIGNDYWEVSEDGMPVRRVSEAEYYKNNPDARMSKLEEAVAETVKDVELGTSEPVRALQKRQVDKEAAQAAKDIENAKRRRAIQKKYNLGDKFKLRDEPAIKEDVAVPAAKESIGNVRQNIKQNLEGSEADEAEKSVDRYQKLVDMQKKFLDDAKAETENLHKQEQEDYTEAKAQKKNLRIAKIIGNLINMAAYLHAAGKGIGKTGAKLDLKGIDISDDVAEINEDLRQRQSMLRNQVRQLKDLRETEFKLDTGLEDRRIKDEDAVEAAKANESSEESKRKYASDKELRTAKKKLITDRLKSVMDSAEKADINIEDDAKFETYALQAGVPQDEVDRLLAQGWTNWGEESNEEKRASLEKYSEIKARKLNKQLDQLFLSTVKNEVDAETINQTVKMFPSVPKKELAELHKKVSSGQISEDDALEAAKRLEEKYKESGEKPDSRYKEALAEFESGELGYDAVNEQGFVGKYQFGNQALSDAGYIKPEFARKANNKVLDNEDAWTGKDGIYSKEDFLADPQAQETASDLHIERLKKALKINGVIDESTSEAEVYAHVAGAHLIGIGDYLKDRNIKDANGVSGNDYYNRMLDRLTNGQ